MGYVEAVRAVWMLYIRGKMALLDGLGLDSQKREALDAFSSCRCSSEIELNGFEAIILLTQIPGVFEACSGLLKQYDLETGSPSLRRGAEHPKERNKQ